jgi:hypothetical protein
MTLLLNMSFDGPQTGFAPGAANTAKSKAGEKPKNSLARIP